MSRSARIITTALVVLTILAAPSGPNLMAKMSTSETAQIARALVALAEFTTWPNGYVSPDQDILLVGILGDKAYQDLVKELFRERPGQQTIVRRLKRAADAMKCQIVYVAESDASQIRIDLEQLHDIPALTVSNTEGFARLGGMVELEASSHDVGLTLNLAAITDRGLTISSRVIEIADLYEEQGPE